MDVDYGSPRGLDVEIDSEVAIGDVHNGAWDRTLVDNASPAVDYRDPCGLEQVLFEPQAIVREVRASLEASLGPRHVQVSEAMMHPAELAKQYYPVCTSTESKPHPIRVRDLQEGQCENPLVGNTDWAKGSKAKTIRTLGKGGCGCEPLELSGRSAAARADVDP